MQSQDLGWRWCVRRCESSWAWMLRGKRCNMLILRLPSHTVHSCHGRVRDSPGRVRSCTALVSMSAWSRDPSGSLMSAIFTWVSCANRKRGENRHFIAPFLFPSSERSHHKILPDKAYRQPLDDLMAMSKAERAPERSLIQPPAHDTNRLWDYSSERSEGRLP